jgi:RNA polymerase sigma-70 factor, ECF subfamily
MSGPAVDGTDDRTLLDRHVSGDREAFGELVARHRDRLWRVALRTLGDPEDAADAVQDALLSAYRAAPGFRGDAAVTTWLHRIVVNACLDLRRRRAVRPAGSLEDGPEPATGDDTARHDTATDVLAALRSLPFEQAAAVVLVDVEGYPVAEAAEILEIPVGTVKSRCARARARLAEILRDPGAPAGNPAGAQPVQADESREERA